MNKRPGLAHLKKLFLRQREERETDRERGNRKTERERECCRKPVIKCAPGTGLKDFRSAQLS